VKARNKHQPDSPMYKMGFIALQVNGRQVFLGPDSELYREPFHADRKADSWVVSSKSEANRNASSVIRPNDAVE